MHTATCAARGVDTYIHSRPFFRHEGRKGDVGHVGHTDWQCDNEYEKDEGVKISSSSDGKKTLDGVCISKMYR